MFCPGTPSHAEQVLGLGIISGASLRFFAFHVADFLATTWFDEDDCVGALHPSKIMQTVACVSLPVILV